MKGLGGLGDLGGLMKQAQQQFRQIQEQLQRIEEDLKDRAVEGSAGGGMVKVLFNGKQEPLDVKIDPALLEDEDIEFLQEMILAALRQGHKKSRELEEQEKAKITAGIKIPGLQSLL